MNKEKEKLNKSSVKFGHCLQHALVVQQVVLMDNRIYSLEFNFLFFVWG